MNRMLIIENLSTAFKEKITGTLPLNWEALFFEREEKEWVLALEEAKVLYISPSLLTKERLDTAPKLSWVHVTTAGLNDLPLKEIEERGLILSSSHGLFHAIPIAEHVLAMMLFLTHSFQDFFHQKNNRIWERKAIDILWKKKVGILGLGNLGRRVASTCQCMGMEVIGVNSTGSPLPDLKEVYPLSSLEKVLQESHFLVIALPLTPKTYALIGREELNLMPPSSYLINVARGEIVVEEDLILALQEGPLAGAGLDVFHSEPLPPDSPFYALPNVILTPHVSANTSSFKGAKIQLFLKNFFSYLKGDPLEGEVDWEKGY